MEKEDLRKTFTHILVKDENLINKVCSIYTYNQADFEDLKQDIVYQLWKSFPGFRNESKVQTWMYRVALNTALYYKRQQKMVMLPLDIKHENIEDVGYEHDKEEKFGQLFKAIKHLKNLEKAIVFLYLEKCPYEKIAEITGLTEKNVGVKLVRIKEALRKKLNINN